MQKENVKTLPTEVCDKIYKLASPRLVEYWEQDPCAPPEPIALPRSGVKYKVTKPVAKEASAEDLGVTVEAKFTVGEYDVVILSARDSTGLESSRD